MDMRQNFDGLRKVIEREKPEIGNAAKSVTILFINRKRTAFKLLAGDFLVFYKSSHGRIPLDALKYLPETFGGSVMEMNDAIRKSLREKLGISKE